MLPLGLGSVGAGAFGSNTQLEAGSGPCLGPVAAAVVGQYALDGDTTVGKPGHRPAQDCGRGFSGLVGVDLGIDDMGMVVDHGMHERVSQQRITVAVAAGSGCGGALAAPGHASDEPPTTTIGDVAQLLDVDMDQRPSRTSYTQTRWGCCPPRAQSDCRENEQPKDYNSLGSQWSAIV